MHQKIQASDLGCSSPPLEGSLLLTRGIKASSKEVDVLANYRHGVVVSCRRHGALHQALGAQIRPLHRVRRELEQLRRIPCTLCSQAQSGLTPTILCRWPVVLHSCVGELVNRRRPSSHRRVRHQPYNPEQDQQATPCPSMPSVKYLASSTDEGTKSQGAPNLCGTHTVWRYGDDIMRH